MSCNDHLLVLLTQNRGAPRWISHTHDFPLAAAIWNTLTDQIGNFIATLKSELTYAGDGSFYFGLIARFSTIYEQKMSRMCLEDSNSNFTPKVNFKLELGILTKGKKDQALFPVCWTAHFPHFPETSCWYRWSSSLLIPVTQILYQYWFSL